MDFLEYLGPDTSAIVFRQLDDPADLAHASAVSRSWRRFVIANQFSKIQCLRAYPEVANFTHIEASSSARARQNAGSSACAEFDKLERDHRVYMQLSHGLLSPSGTKVCIIRCIGPSSTDRYPDEAMENTLVPADHVGETPSYWSSRGHRDPAAMVEFLMYRLPSDLCLVDEIKVQPLKAFFRDDEPIYSAKRIRFVMGYPKSHLRSERLVYAENEGRVIADSNYIWTYTSPEFPMLQENVLQSFKLPCPVLCIGGVVKIELLGGVVKDAFDGRYYICVSHVQVVGKPLSRELGVAPHGNGVVLSYYPDPRKMPCSSQPLYGRKPRDEWLNHETKFKVNHSSATNVEGTELVDGEDDESYASFVDSEFDRTDGDDLLTM
ncbi:unnamed protein product [Alopecurus aequalis]